MHIYKHVLVKLIMCNYYVLIKTFNLKSKEETREQEKGKKGKEEERWDENRGRQSWPAKFTNVQFGY